MNAGTHGSTFGGNQLACSVALAVIKEVTKKTFLNKVEENALYLRNKLEKIKKIYPEKIISIKGKGLLLGLELNHSTSNFCNLAREKKLLLVPAANNVIRLLPPLNIKKNEIKLALTILEKCLKEIN